MPIKMSDASAVNGKKMAQTIDANCLAHGRGKFKEKVELLLKAQDKWRESLLRYSL